MINLIPNQDKKKMIQHFYARLLIVLLLALTISLFIGSVALLPAYFISATQKDIATQKLASQKSAPLPKYDQDALLVVQDLNDKFKLLEAAEANRYIVTERIIKHIVSEKPSNIKLDYLSYSTDNPEAPVVSLRGFAPSRESLLAFRSVLQNDKNFTNIDLPISNFIKSNNIQFSITVTTVKDIN
jgi:hypothetical protein